MKIGLIGTGLMGQTMALKLNCAHRDFFAYNRTKAKLEPLKAAGIRVVDSPEAAIAPWRSFAERNL